MKISFVEIQNFRKLKSCRIELSDSTTVFVGANNSGKTSAMDALVLFLGENTKISPRDFTISNWLEIDAIGERWKNHTNQNPVDISEWIPLLPTIDFWIEIKNNELHYVSGIIPTLDWSGGLLGVRIRFEPQEITELYADFLASVEINEGLRASSGEKLKSLVSSLYDFLSQGNNLTKYFKLFSYILDQTKLVSPSDGVAKPQELSSKSVPLDFDPFNGLIKVDVINAQRGFSDVNTPVQNNDSFMNGNLSTQLREYYGKHINPTDSPLPEDIDALLAIEGAQNAFDKNISKGFSAAINELESLGYPGFSDPKISLSSRVQPLDSLNHSSAVQFDVVKSDGSGYEHLRLPEKYNGLGYQNLISMIFKLMRFRDEWMRVGKLKTKTRAVSSEYIEPIHLVFLEEPEAHLHAQVQQVFINKAYSVLRNHPNLKENQDFQTQLIVTTHSSHLAHEIDFSCLRYFRRRASSCEGEAPTVTVVNLSEIFGGSDETTRFAIRYLKTTHCDLFFADAAILVEGPAERMLVPHFIKTHFKELTQRYITILEIGGSHAHRLRALIETLGIFVLVITDIDSINPLNNGKAILPAKSSGYLTNNSTLKNWLPKKEEIDALYAMSESGKVDASNIVRVAYQMPLDVIFRDVKAEVLPYTFEDALIFANIHLFVAAENSKGFLNIVNTLVRSDNPISQIAKDLFDSLRQGNRKAEFALDVLFTFDPDALQPPQYIENGLQWLLDVLKANCEKDDIHVSVEGLPHE